MVGLISVCIENFLMENKNVNWDSWLKNQALMLIRMDLESLPDNLEKLVEKSYEFSSSAEKSLKEEAEKAFADIEKMPENIEQTEEGEVFCEKYWIESQAEDYFFEQESIIKLYDDSINKMLINFFFESFEGLKKRILNKLKKAGIDPSIFRTCVFEPVLPDMAKVRLINNCIKHNDCIVSKELHAAYPLEYAENELISIDAKLVYELLKKTQEAIIKVSNLLNQYY